MILALFVTASFVTAVAAADKKPPRVTQKKHAITTSVKVPVQPPQQRRMVLLGIGF